jgi:hypothetical protein
MFVYRLTWQLSPSLQIVVEHYYVHANPSCPELWGKTSTIALNKGEKDINEFLVGETMYTGRDGYRHMEVVFVKGHLKGHLGVVVDSRHEDENPTFVVRTSSQTITHVHTVQADDIRERLYVFIASDRSRHSFNAQYPFADVQGVVGSCIANRTSRCTTSRTTENAVDFEFVFTRCGNSVKSRVGSSCGLCEDTKSCSYASRAWLASN